MASCHPDRKYYAKDLCRSCYMKPFQKSWVSRNLDLHRQMCREWTANNRNHIRDNELKREFGMAPDQYDAILVAQGGHCRFCSRTPLKYKSLAVEHNHKTGVIRGIVCVNHNNMIRHVEENLGRLSEIVNYLASDILKELPDVKV